MLFVHGTGFPDLVCEIGMAGVLSSLGCGAQDWQESLVSHMDLPLSASPCAVVPVFM